MEAERVRRGASSIFFPPNFGGRPVLQATLCFFFPDAGGRPDVRKCPVPPLPPRDAAGSLWTFFF